jgi:hypothetical protein
MMKRRWISLLLLGLVAVASAWITTTPIDFTTLVSPGVLAAAGDTLRTYAISWGDAPYMSFSWNAYGDASATYYVGFRWADGWGHFVKDLDTLAQYTVAAAESTRATARRYTVGFQRPVSAFGAFVFFSPSDTLYIDSTATVRER